MVGISFFSCYREWRARSRLTTVSVKRKTYLCTSVAQPEAYSSSDSQQLAIPPKKNIMERTPFSEDFRSHQAGTQTFSPSTSLRGMDHNFIKFPALKFQQNFLGFWTFRVFQFQNWEYHQSFDQIVDNTLQYNSFSFIQ